MVGVVATHNCVCGKSVEAIARDCRSVTAVLNAGWRVVNAIGYCV